MTARTGWLLAGLAALWVAAPAALVVARWPSWWAWIAPEQTPMTWLQSVVLVLAAAGSALIAVVSARGAAPGARVWWLLAAGMLALALDERFALHERLRDGVLAPRNITVPLLPWVAPGDFLLLVAGLIGLAILPFVWRALRPDLTARRTFAVGVVLAAAAVGMDSVDPATWSVTQERVQQTMEEIIELGGVLALLAATTIRLLGLLDTLLARPQSSAESSPSSSDSSPSSSESSESSSSSESSASSASSESSGLSAESG